MLELLLYIVLFVVAFFIIIKAADYFVDEAAYLGDSFGMSKLMIGLTIVAIGTSLPELITSLSAIFFTENFSDFIIGTAMGSNITNIVLAFGIFLLFSKTFTVEKKETFNVLVLLTTTILFSYFILVGYVPFLAILLVPLYGFYVYHQSKVSKKTILKEEELMVEKQKKHPAFQSIGILFFSFIFIFIGARLVVFSIEEGGALLGIPAAYLTLTTIALATSLPEIAVTVSSARKKEYLIAIGNILGTNIMNVCLIIGLSALTLGYNVNSETYILSVIIFLVSTLIFSLMILFRKFYFVGGFIFLAMYVVYMIQFIF